MPKVLHLCRTSRGGAAAAAINLHKSLLAAGVDSIMYFGSDFDLGDRHNGIEAILSEAISKNRTELSNTFFTINPLDGFPDDCKAVEDAEIIHLHWVSGLVGAQTIKRWVAAGKRIVWTLHDTRPATGGCHFPAGCEQFKTNCADCLQTLPRLHSAVELGFGTDCAILGALPITVVAPSRWMAGVASASEVFRSATVVHIPYGVDSDHFTPVLDRRDAIGQLNLDPEKRYILLGANDTQEKRKGVLHALGILRAMSALMTKEAAALWGVVCIGVSPPELAKTDLGFEFTQLGMMPSEMMPCVYSACDFILFTPQEDNLPNMLLEALACGVVPVVRPVGGIAEIVSDGINGIILPESSVDQAALKFYQIISQIDSLSEMSANAIVSARENFSLEAQQTKVQSVYRILVEGETAPQLDVDNPPQINSQREKFLEEIVALMYLEIKDSEESKLREEFAAFQLTHDRLGHERLEYIEELENVASERLACIADLDAQLRESGSELVALRERIRKNNQSRSYRLFARLLGWER